MAKNFFIPLVVYPFDLMVSIGETDKQLFDKFGEIEGDPGLNLKQIERITKKLLVEIRS